MTIVGRLSFRGIIVLIAAVVGSILVVAPPAALTVAQGRTGGLVLVALSLWATALIPEHVTALLFFLAMMLFHAAPAGTVFSGFESAAWWLIFGGLVIGAAVRGTGLGDRVARRLIGWFGTSYAGVVAGVTAIGLALGFLLPSSIGRAVLILPIAVSLADRCGFGRHDKGRTGLVLAAAFGVHIPTFAILPANVPNMVLTGAAETLYGYTPLYGRYLWLHFPVLGALKAIVTALLIVWLFPDHAKTRTDATTTAAPAPASRDEWRLTAILIAALLLWMTDFLHHINPAWVSLAAGVICLLPFVNLVSPKTFNQDIGIASLILISGIMGVGAVVAESGLGDLLAHRVLSILPLAPGANGANFAAFSALGIVTAMVTTLAGVPAVLTPLAGELSRASGWSLDAVLMAQVLGFSTVVFPYQSGPLIVGMQLGGETALAAAKLCLWLSLVTIVVLLPLDFFWWQLVGMF